MVISRVEDEAVVVAVLARAPVPGFAKTRLIPSLGAEAAADLQAAFILRTLQTALAAGLGPVSLWCAPDCAHPLFGRCRRDFAVSLYPQCAGNIGERMAFAFADLCLEGPALLVGTDCPALTPGHLKRAAQVLRKGCDAVFFPAEDGGYVLAGLRRATPLLFQDIPWGGPEVMVATRQRLRQAACRWQEPASLWDVDRPGDIARLRASGLMDGWFERFSN